MLITWPTAFLLQEINAQIGSRFSPALGTIDLLSHLVVVFFSAIFVTPAINVMILRISKNKTLCLGNVRPVIQITTDTYGKSFDISK